MRFFLITVSAAAGLLAAAFPAASEEPEDEPATAASASDPHAAVLAADAARIAALMEGDVATLERLTADDYTHVSSDGKLRTKTEFIDGQRSRQQRFASWVIDENNVRIYGDVAIVTGRYHNAFEGADGAALPAKHARHVRVYVRQDGEWINVAHQATEIAEP